MPTETAVIHEAAHACAAMHFGLVPDLAEIHGGGGIVRAKWDTLTDEQMMLCGLIGDAAVRMLLDSDAETLSVEDLDLAADGIGACMASGRQSAARQAIQTEVDRLAWSLTDEILCVANELLARHRLNAQNLVSLVHSRRELSAFRDRIPKPTRAPSKSRPKPKRVGASGMAARGTLKRVLAGTAKLPEGMSAGEVISRVLQARSSQPS